MILLLDTHAILWFWWDDPQLSLTAKALICDPSNRKLVSLASASEVAMKVSVKKLDIGGPYLGFFPQQMLLTGFERLPITDEQLTLLSTLPFHHKDPFDRLLVAEALEAAIPIFSADAAFDPYGGIRLWQ
jgi:PIN domain nuclease of toxin-antitoxin system